MEKENKFKLKISKIFTSSCKTQDISEVIDHQNPIFTAQTPLIEVDEHHQNPAIITRHNKQALLSSTFPSPYPSSMMCKPRCPESFDQMVRKNCIIPAAGNPFPRRKIAGKYTLLSPSAAGRRCPPASPASTLEGLDSVKKKKERKKKKKKQRMRNPTMAPLMKDNPYSFSSSNETDIGDYFSSDDEREDEGAETETLFSSVKSLSLSSRSLSLSSDSEGTYPARPGRRVRGRRREKGRKKPTSARAERAEVGVVPLEGKVQDTFAVMKSSSDPYSDFRTSMVEMIIEKQIFGAKELEHLLDCFLSLNSPHHHRVIVEVFTEIWDALFSHLC